MIEKITGLTIPLRFVARHSAPHLRAKLQSMRPITTDYKDDFTVYNRSARISNNVQTERCMSIHAKKSSPPQILNVWGRVVRGLEWVAAAEVSLSQIVSKIKISHREVFFDTTQAAFLSDSKRMSCFDDGFVKWGKAKTIGKTKAALEDLHKIVSSLPELPGIAKDFTSMRVTASVLGSVKRNYSRFDLENNIGWLIEKKTGLKYLTHDDVLTENPVWIRAHFTRENSIFGLRVSNKPLHRRDWRSETVAGSLHPPVAAAMCMLADIGEHDTVLDPFMGAGTILLEAGQKKSKISMVGVEVNPDNVCIAKQNFSGVHFEPKIIVADSNSCELPKVDRIVTNPPWGNLVDMNTPLNIHNIMNSLKKDGRAVFLVDQSLNFRNLLLQEGYRPLFIQNLRISGRLAEIIIVDGTGQTFRKTPEGIALAKAWKGLDSEFLNF